MRVACCRWRRGREVGRGQIHRSVVSVDGHRARTRIRRYGLRECEFARRQFPDNCQCSVEATRKDQPIIKSRGVNSGADWEVRDNLSVVRIDNN